MLTVLSCLLAICLLSIGLKIIGFMFSASFAITGFVLKIVVGILCSVISMVILFSVIGVFAIFVFIPVALIVFIARKGTTI